MCKLLTIALDDQNHELDRYIAAWTALEVFINKAFDDRFRKEATERIALSNQAAALEDVRYNLLHKFVIIASLLREREANEDIMLF